MPAVSERPLGGEPDFWRVRDLLVETYPLTPAGFNWEVRNWEGKRLYDENPGWDPAWQAASRLWQTAAGRLVAALHPDSLGFAVLELHPDYRRRLEPQLLSRAEQLIALPVDDSGTRRLRLYVFAYDTERQRLLAARGYHQLAAAGVTRRLRFDRPHSLPATPPLPPGYSIRTTRPGSAEDGAQIAALLNAAFNRDFHTAAEYLTFSRLAPSFRHDLDLVAVAPDGTFAAYVGIPYVAENAHALFEPVCTHPAHQRQGLARTLMLAGLHRLRALGAVDVSVETGTMIPANRLYDSLGFAETHRGYLWERIIQHKG